jgi:hypothetical protein
MKQHINEIKRMQQLAGLIKESQLKEGKYSTWWAKANDELGLEFEDDIYDYFDADEPWQRKFAKEVDGINADNYEDFKSQVKKLYKKSNPF